MIEFKLFLLEPKTAIVGFFEKGSALESVFMLFGCMYSKKFHFGCTTTPAVMNQLDEKYFFHLVFEASLSVIGLSLQ